MNKQKVFVGLIGLVLLIVVSALLLHQSKGTNQVNHIKIGVTMPLTGKYAYIGEEIRDGLILATEEINKQKKEYQLDLIIEDNKGEAKDAVNSVNKFINVDQAEIIFSTFTHITSAIKDLTANSNKLLFYMATVPDFAKANKLTFRDYFDAADCGQAIAQAVADKGYKKVAFLSEISENGKQFKNGFVQEAEKLGIKIISEQEIPAEQTDLKTNLLKLNLPEVDALVTDNWKQENILMKQLKELNLLSTPTFHWVAPYLPAANTEEIKKLYEENQAISAWYGITENTDKEKQIEFKVKYRLKYNKEATPDSAYAYDDIYVISQALEACQLNAQNKDCLAEKINSVKYQGAGGYLEFDGQGVSKREIMLIQVKDGKWQEI
jgi:branched-chain amino acid transport system substrate-binding protein